MVGEYIDFIQELILEENPIQSIEYCPSCGALSVINHICEICFESVEHKTCIFCEEDFFVIESYPFEVECPACGKIQVTAK